MKRQYLIFVDMCTGTMGEGATDVILTEEVSTVRSYHELVNGCHTIANEMAKDNALSFDNDGANYCNGCGEVPDNSDVCECCGSDDISWEENDGIEGTPSMYNPKLHDGKRAGGGSFLEEYPTAIEDEKDYYYVPVLEGDAQRVVDMLLEKLENTRAQALGLAEMNSVLVRSISEITEQVSYATNQTEIILNKMGK